MKIGDRIRTIGTFKGIEGIVTKIEEGYDTSDHGTIEIRVDRITDPDEYSWLEPGDLEHFVHYNWEKDLEIVS